jgi:hypothetical protein
MTEPTARVEFIDPERAEQMLGTMRANRKLSSRTVTRLAKMMKEGLWVYDGSPIRFNTRGELVDGQHRLWALLEAEHEDKFLVVRGVAPEAMATMDTGKSRSFSDILSLEDSQLAQVHSLAAAVQIIYRWEDGRRGAALATSGAGNAGTVPNAVLLEFFRENRDRLVEVASTAANRHRVRGISGAAMALALWIFEAIDSADSEFFFGRLKDGVGLEEGHPILALRGYISRALAGQSGRAAISSDLSIALLIKAWNAYREGDKIRQLSYRRGGSNPEAFPTPL